MFYTAATTEFVVSINYQLLYVIYLRSANNLTSLAARSNEQGQRRDSVFGEAALRQKVQ
jgi:hypothetical protein